MLYHWDLFSGSGGFLVAAKWAGFVSTLACEPAPFCRSRLQERFPDTLFVGDARTLQPAPKEFHLLTALLPTKHTDQAGMAKEYGWGDVVRVAKEGKPRWIVVATSGYYFADLYAETAADLEAEGYEVRAMALPLAATGAPISGIRYVIVAYANHHRQIVRALSADLFARPRDYYRKLRQRTSQPSVGVPPAGVPAYLDRPHLNYWRPGWDDGLSKTIPAEAVVDNEIEMLSRTIPPQWAYIFLRHIFLEETK